MKPHGSPVRVWCGITHNSSWAQSRGAATEQKTCAALSWASHLNCMSVCPHLLTGLSVDSWFGSPVAQISLSGNRVVSIVPLWDTERAVLEKLRLVIVILWPLFSDNLIGVFHQKHPPRRNWWRGGLILNDDWVNPFFYGRQGTLPSRLVG